MCAQTSERDSRITSPELVPHLAPSLGGEDVGMGAAHYIVTPVNPYVLSSEVASGGSYDS